MPLALAIISAIMQARQMKRSDDKLGSAVGLLGSAYNIYNTGGMGSTSSYDSSLGDFGVRRNYL